MQQEESGNEPHSESTTIRRFFLKVGGVLAYILHPVFLFFYCVLFIQLRVPIAETDHAYWEILIVLFALTIFLPAVFSFVFGKDIFLRRREKRLIPLLMTLICYTGCFFWIQSFLKYNDSAMDRWVNELGLFLRLLAIIIPGLLWIFIVSFRFKISLHANGIGLILTLMIFYNIRMGNWNNPVVLCTESAIIILCTLLAWQRIASGAHRRSEVVAGLISGFTISCLAGYYFILK